MNTRVRKHWYWAVVMLLGAATMAFGQHDTMRVDPIPGSQPNLNGVYTGAYPFSINGSTAVTPAVCDDYNDEIYVGESWTANVTQLSSLGQTVNNTVYFDNGPTSTAALQQQAYDEAAYLVQEMSNPPAGTSVSDISFAIWNLFDPGADSGLSQSNLNAVNSLLASAQANWQSVNTSNFEILSYDTGTTISCPSGDTCGRPQEFIVYTPEPSSVMLLGTGLLGLFGLMFASRRRLVRQVL